MSDVLVTKRVRGLNKFRKGRTVYCEEHGFGTVAYVARKSILVDYPMPNMSPMVFQVAYPKLKAKQLLRMSK